MDRALAPLRPLVWLLAAALVVSLAALPAQARDLVETDTWIDLADDEPALGDTITITAFVEQVEDPEAGAVPGQVRFSAGTSEAGPFGTSLGQATLAGGEANLDFTVVESALPPGTTDSVYVVAEYLGDATFEGSTSDPVRIEITPTDPTDPVPTSIQVTGPTQGTGDEETTLTATVQPAEATGTVTFTVDGSEVGTVAVDAGEASMPYTFIESGTYEASVVASFQPDDLEQYLPSTSPELLVWIHASLGPAYSWNPSFGLGLGCRPTAPASDSSGPVRRIPNPFTMFIDFGFPDFSPLFTFKPFISLFGSFTLDFEACIFGGIVIGPYGTRAETTVPVDCFPTETGYQCRLELPGPPSSMTIEPSIPVPAEFAGQTIPVTTTVTQIDPDGVESTLLDETTSVDVPRRTSLAVGFAPVKGDVTSVKRGKTVGYRLSVQNAGIVTANGVKACVTVSKGAGIKTAKGATVRGRQACWTLPSLKSTRTQARTLTLVAPKKAGDLTLTARVTPKPSQADPVTLTRVLPVR